MCLLSVFYFDLSCVVCATVSAGTMLTARPPSPSSARSTSDAAVSCCVRTPSAALSQGCASSTCAYAASCWPCDTGPCPSRAASRLAACAAPAPRWTAWRLGPHRERESDREMGVIKREGWEKCKRLKRKGRHMVRPV